VRERDALLLGDDAAGERRIDVADHHHHVGPTFAAYLLKRSHYRRSLLRVRRPAEGERHVRRGDLEVLEEHVVHLAVEVLAGVHQ
jgi:hypothetical protein